MEVLVTGVGKQTHTLTARTSCHRVVHFDSDLARTPLGHLTDVTIEKALPHSLLARSSHDLQPMRARTPYALPIFGGGV